MRKVLLTWLKFNFGWDFSQSPPTFLLVQDSLAYHFADSLITADKLMLLYRAAKTRPRRCEPGDTNREIFKDIFARGPDIFDPFLIEHVESEIDVYFYPPRYRRSFIFITRKMCRARTSSRNPVTVHLTLPCPRPVSVSMQTSFGAISVVVITSERGLQCYFFINQLFVV